MVKYLHPDHPEVKPSVHTIIFQLFLNSFFEVFIDVQSFIDVP